MRAPSARVLLFLAVVRWRVDRRLLLDKGNAVINKQPHLQGVL